MVDMVSVSSSNVAAVGWENNVLHVHFLNGGQYTYDGVPQEEFENLKNADSVGQYLNSKIKPNYTFKKVA